MIFEAITKGIDPNVEKKDSGIKQIGQIPIHWDCCSLKFLTTKIGSGKTPSGGAEVYTNSGLLAAAMTMFFSFLVNLVMGRKMKKIDMVESMKAGE